MRGSVAWALFVVLTWTIARLLYVAARLPYRIAPAGEIERRLGDRSWLERYAEARTQQPTDYVEGGRRPW